VIPLAQTDGTNESKLRKYGLEFIKDLAKDRKIAIQTLGVSISGFKNDLLNRSSIITRHEDRLHVDSLLKSFDEDVNRTIESQLTRITMTSFNWIKNMFIEDETFESIEIGQKLDQEDQQRLKTQTNELSRLTHLNDSLQGQLTVKEKEFTDIETRFNEYQKEMQNLLVEEKTTNENLSFQLEETLSNLNEKSTKVTNKDELFIALEEKNASLQMEIIEKSAEVSRLNSLMESQASEAMETWASAYSEQQDEYQKLIHEQQEKYKFQDEQFQLSLTTVKQEYEESANTRLREKTKQFQVEIQELESKLTEAQKKTADLSTGLHTQIAELNSKNVMLEDKTKQMDVQITELLELSDTQSKNITDYKIQVDEINSELKEAKNRESDFKLTKVTTQTLNKVRNINDYIEQVLSLSNYAPIAILIRMDGEMSLEALAKSVGMDPIVLENQLKPLHQRDLIDLKHDGRVVANIPISED
jgi:chromosome segregation ATPase